MGKLHTRLKRKENLCHNQKHTLKAKTSFRPKTFKTEESANKWAEENKIKDYKLENIKSPESKTKKLRIIKK